MLIALLVPIALAFLLGTIVPQAATIASPATQPARNVTVLAGFGQDTVDVLAFFPQNLQIRAGERHALASAAGEL